MMKHVLSTQPSATSKTAIVFRKKSKISNVKTKTGKRHDEKINNNENTNVEGK